jgi:hypothetical protein
MIKLATTVYINRPDGLGLCKNWILPSSKYVANIQTKYIPIAIAIYFILGIRFCTSRYAVSRQYNLTLPNVGLVLQLQCNS